MGAVLDQQGLGRVVPPATATPLLAIVDRQGEVSAWHSKLPDDRQIAWASPSAVAKHCPIFVKPKQPSSVAPRTANNARIIEEQEARIEELEQELESARQGKAKPSKAALDVLTWHDLIQRAIAVLRAMPEDSRHEAMNQWSSQIALSVTFPGKAPARKARTVRPAAPAPRAAEPLQWKASPSLENIKGVLDYEASAGRGKFTLQASNNGGLTSTSYHVDYYDGTKSRSGRMNSLRIGQVRTAKAAKALAERRYSLTPSVDEELAQCYRDRPKGDYGSEGSWNSAVK